MTKTALGSCFVLKKPEGFLMVFGSVPRCFLWKAVDEKPWIVLSFIPGGGYTVYGTGSLWLLQYKYKDYLIYKWKPRWGSTNQPGCSMECNRYFISLTSPKLEFTWITSSASKQDIGSQPWLSVGETSVKHKLPREAPDRVIPKLGSWVHLRFCWVQFFTGMCK